MWSDCIFAMIKNIISTSENTRSIIHSRLKPLLDIEVTIFTSIFTLEIQIFMKTHIHGCISCTFFIRHNLNNCERYQSLILNDKYRGWWQWIKSYNVADSMEDAIPPFAKLLSYTASMPYNRTILPFSVNFIIIYKLSYQVVHIKHRVFIAFEFWFLYADKYETNPRECYESCLSAKQLIYIWLALRECCIWILLNKVQ